MMILLVPCPQSHCILVYATLLYFSIIAHTTTSESVWRAVAGHRIMRQMCAYAILLHHAKIAHITATESAWRMIASHRIMLPNVFVCYFTVPFQNRRHHDQ